MSKQNNNKKSTEFSKELLNQEKVLVWIVTLVTLGITIYCIIRGFTGSLPWLATIVGFPWTAYGVSQACYYSKAKAENTKGGIKFESIFNNLNKDKETKEHEFDSSPYDEDSGADASEDLDPFGPI